MSDTESFEASLCELMGYFYDNSYATRLCERIRRAHDREIRDVSQQQYDRGFHAGQHSMDAEHRAVAMRLRALPLDGGSHENLSQIARAIWHNDFGWTQGACAALRDKLIDLMGGVSDDTCGAGCCCAAADCDGDCGLQHEEVTDERLADDSADDSRSGAGCDVVHLDGLVTYDVLDNERRKAVCELRKLTIDSDYHSNYQRIALAIGTVYDGRSFASECVRDRLIHLLGGDQPSGIDAMRAMDDGHSRTCPKSDEEMSKNAPSVSITDELRKWADGDVWSCKWEEFKAIADRIDEQFDRICQQHEAVLQETIDDVVKEYEHDRESDQLRIEKLVSQRDAAYACADELSDELLRVRREHDEAREERDRLKRDMLDKWVPRTSYEEKVEKYRRAYMESDAWRKSLQEKLNAMRDAITAALNG